MNGPARGNLRKHPRSAIELPVTVADAANKVQAVIEFDTRDVSVGGAFIRSDLLFEVGEELSLVFSLPGGHTVRGRGRVVRVARDTDANGARGMGIAFAQLNDRDRAAIVQLVSGGDHG